MNIRNHEDLVRWLRSNNIDTSQWGKGDAKTIESLWDEINSGEIVLQDSPPLRVVNVAQVVVVRDDKALIETEQTLSDGRKRKRNRAPSEKMWPGETYREAAIRCLEEELGVPAHNISILESSYRRSDKELQSPSYPGLNTKYIIHVVEAVVEGLPDTDFWTSESQHGDPTMSHHHWSWSAYDDVSEQ